MSRIGLPTQELQLGPVSEAVRERLSHWESTEVRNRLREKDPNLWPFADPQAIASRLGWIDLPQDAWLWLDSIKNTAVQARQRGMENTILIGMGGSSLAPLVIENCFRSPAERRLTVLDTTHPDCIRSVIDGFDSDRWQCVVASKSGTTLETQVLTKVVYHALERFSKTPGGRFFAITDQDSPLHDFARDSEFRETFVAPADVGGRFSALSVFGLLPAALSGHDPEQLLHRAHAMEDSCLRDLSSPGLELGAALGELALAGRDKLTIFGSPSAAPFSLWLEQLVAESLGKDGKGVVPVAGEPRGEVDSYRDDRVFVGFRIGDEGAPLELLLEELAGRGHPTISIHLRDVFDLGAEFFRWEVAVAAAAMILEVDPFDQPDVERAKQTARSFLEDENAELAPPPTVSTGDRQRLGESLHSWIGSAERGDYFAILAYVPPSIEMDHELSELQRRLRDLTGLPATAAYGPRYLHSSGQLHKGGPNNGVFLQIMPTPGTDFLIPDTEWSLGKVLAAQADGDAVALTEGGRRLLRVEPEDDVRQALWLVRQLLSR